MLNILLGSKYAFIIIIFIIIYLFIHHYFNRNIVMTIKKYIERNIRNII